MNIRRLEKKSGEQSSERRLAVKAGLSRTTLRRLVDGHSNPRLSSFLKAAEALELAYHHFFSPLDPLNSDYCIPVISQKILIDGEESWKVHLMNFVDYFRTEQDPRLILNPPIMATPAHLKALIAASVWKLCWELDLKIPEWIFQVSRLSKPLFVSGIENLKATAIVESPLPFRYFNLFVLSNFLERV